MLVILVLNVGLTHITHYCGGEAVESTFSLVHSDISCGMTSAEMESCTNDKHTEGVQKKGCCENEYTSISADIDYNNTQVAASTHLDIKFLAAFAYSFVSNYFEQEEKQSFESYRPPCLDQDISVLHQVFII